MNDVTPATTPPTRPAANAPTTLGELFAQILRRMLVMTILVTIVGAILGWFVSDTAGLWGAFIGGLIGLVFCATTVISMQVGEGRSPQFLATVVLGGWLVKMLVIIIVLAVLRSMTFYDKYVLAATLGGIVIGSLAIEVLALQSARIPLVQVPPPGEEAEPGEPGEPDQLTEPHQATEPDHSGQPVAPNQPVEPNRSDEPHQSDEPRQS